MYKFNELLDVCKNVLGWNPVFTNNYVYLKKIKNVDYSSISEEKLTLIASDDKGFGYLYWFFTQNYLVFYKVKGPVTGTLTILSLDDEEKVKEQLENTWPSKPFNPKAFDLIEGESIQAQDFYLEIFLTKAYKYRFVDEKQNIEQVDKNQEKNDDIMERLEKLGKMRKMELITEQEFQEKKQELMKKL